MPHTIPLGSQILNVVTVGRHLDGYIFYDLQAVCFQTDTLSRIVGHQPHLMDMEMTKHLRATTIIALVGLEAKVDIGIYGVHTLLLKLIGSNLVHQADTPTLLLHINDDALAFLLDHLHGLVELLATVATHAAQDITGCTGRVDTHEDGLVVLPFSLDERHMLQTVAGLAERDQTEMTIGGWEINLLTDFYAGFFAETIGDKVLDRDDTKSPFLGLLLQRRSTPLS